MTRRSLLLLVMSIVLSAGTLVSAANWPNWRGPTFDGISAETGLNKDWAAKKPPTLWSVPMYDGGYSGPAIVEGVVYIIDHKGPNDVVRALKADTGKTIWESAYPDGGADAREGQARSVPTYDNGKVYTFSKGGKATCFNATDGKILWQQYLKKDFGGQFPDFGYSSSPLVDGKQVIFINGGNNGAGCVALDKETGELIWKSGNYGNPGYGTPMTFNFDGKKQYLNFIGNAVVSVDPETGKENWRYPWITSESCNGVGLSPVGDNAFIGISGYGHGMEMVQVKDNTPKQMWRNPFATKICSPVVLKDLVFCLGENANLACIDVKTGKTMWTQGGFSAGNWCSGLIAADGVLIVMNHLDGAIVLVDPTPNGYKELGRLQAIPRDSSVVAPALCDKKLYVRTRTQLFCVDLSPDTKAVAGGLQAPDLVVTDITTDPAKLAAGDAVALKATVKNQGTAPTPDGVTIGMVFTIDGTTTAVWSDTENKSLAVGASVVLTANGGGTGGKWTATTGAHTITANVDNVNRMTETNKDNNTLKVTINVP